MKFKYLYILIVFTVLFSACNKDKWLEEKPLDFLTPSNSFVQESDFHSALANLYTEVNYAMFDADADKVRNLFYPSDIMYCAESPNARMNEYKTVMFPTYDGVLETWTDFYRMIYDANVIIDRVDNPEIVFSSPEARNAIKAEALFFRAFAYRNLGILFGGVPLVLEEVSTPRRDFVRASREEVWAQCIEDLHFASENLPEINDVYAEGRISKAVAYHLLSELYIITENWDEAINAASAVINNPNFSLMTARFGKRRNDPGDVYWDLFRRDNQNRSSGNTEGLWVRQYEHLSLGGGFSSRWAVFGQTWYTQLRDNNGVLLFIGPTANYGGRGVGIQTLTNYMNNEIWQSDFDNDTRNSKYNIMRDIIATNPASAYYGQPIVASGAFVNFNNDLNRWWTQIYTKLTPIGTEFPEEVFESGIPATNGLLIRTAQNSYTDQYIFRLAETYLLRAEAYLGKGNLQSAADDINVVRNRANAAPVQPSEVTIDYILDERARELVFEEFRLLTLMRLGKLAERVKKYNPVSANFIDEHHNLWPIPQSEIETNIGGSLEQNPGY